MFRKSEGNFGVIEINVSEIANAYAPDFSLGMSIRRFLSTLKNHRISGSVFQHATYFSRWFLTLKNPRNLLRLGF